MTSAINTANIDGAFPEAGKDNNSQGFRDNFTNIVTALDTASTEITNLQNDTAKLNDNNDFLGNIVRNAEYNEFYGSVRNNGTITTPTGIDIENGPFQIVTFGASTTITFQNWPASNLYAKIRLHLKSDTVAARTIVFGTEGGGSIYRDGAFPSPFIVNSTGYHRVVEAWTYDGGTTVFLRYLGEYS